MAPSRLFGLATYAGMVDPKVAKILAARLREGDKKKRLQ